MANRIFRAYPRSTTIERYREIRQLAQQLDQWETLRSEIVAYLKQSRNISLQIEIALDEGQVERALTLLQAEKQTENRHNGPYGSGNFNVGIKVAKAAEESHPQESIEIYQGYVETRIKWRGRENYRVACQYLTSMRKLYQKIGRSDAWTQYIAALRERNRNLPALKDELAKAKLSDNKDLMSNQQLFQVTNHHKESCGIPPQIDEQTFPDVYRSYFENQNGEQAIFLYDYEQERGTLYMGDAGWQHPHDIVDGKAPGLMLDRLEQIWLSACWEACGGLKAVREQI
jgi:hypothetical protein